MILKWFLGQEFDVGDSPVFEKIKCPSTVNCALCRPLGDQKAKNFVIEKGEDCLRVRTSKGRTLYLKLGHARQHGVP